MMDLHSGALMLLGPTMNAKIAFELSERIPHPSIRMKEHIRRAITYAARMKEMGLKAIYPGLEDHPNHGLFKSMANPEYGFGGMLSLDVGMEERACRLMNHLQNSTRFRLMAVSLGYYEMLMSCSGSSTSSELSVEYVLFVFSTDHGLITLLATDDVVGLQICKDKDAKPHIWEYTATLKGHDFYLATLLLKVLVKPACQLTVCILY